MRDPVLRLEAVRAVKNAAVADVVVRPGELALLFGRGRYGPLTNCVLGIRDPVEGRIELLGEDLSRLGTSARRALRGRCATLPGGTVLFSQLDVFDNVALPLRYRNGVDEERIRERVDAAIDFWGLAEVKGMRPPLDVFTSLRVALLRCLMLDAPLVVLENPFERVDDEQRRELDRFVEAIVGRGAGVLVVDA